MDHTKACVVLVSEAGMVIKFVYLCFGSRGNQTRLHMSNKKLLNRLIPFQEQISGESAWTFLCLQLSMFMLSYQTLARSVVAIKDVAKPDAVTCTIIVFLERTLQLICRFWNRREWKENRKCFTSDDWRPSSLWRVLKMSVRE